MRPAEAVFAAESWRKSSYSGSQTESECVEVAHVAHVVGIRDTKDRDGGILLPSRSAWRAFTERL